MITQQIKVKEYTSSSITGKSTRQQLKALKSSAQTHSGLDINFLKFSTAMVKANTTNILNVKEQAYDTLLASLSLFGLIDYNSKDINLKDGFRKKYRDFSKSGRTGELGQAINYIFAQEKLNFKYVVDFDTFLQWNSISSTVQGGTPDYVLIGAPARNLSILESKGSSQKQPLTNPQLRKRLQGAMDNQCTSGVNHLQLNSNFLVSNSYASVVELSEFSETRHSQLHFADPEYDEYEYQDYSLTIRKYYSLWLLFLGIESAIKIFDDAREFEFSVAQFDLIEIDGGEYYLQRISYQDSYLNIPIKYGISKDIVGLLETCNYDRVYKIEGLARSYEDVEIFTDGTIAKFNK